MSWTSFVHSPSLYLGIMRLNAPHKVALNLVWFTRSSGLRNLAESVPEYTRYCGGSDRYLVILVILHLVAALMALSSSSTWPA